MSLIGSLLVLLGYLSLALELVLIPVPSRVSAIQLARREGSEGRGLDRILGLRWYLPLGLNLATFAIPIVLAVLLLLGLVDSNGEGFRYRDIFAAILILVGRGLTIWSAMALRASTELPVLEGSLDVPLTKSGPYAWSRNPGLMGMYAFAAGLLVVLQNFWFALGLCHYVWHMHRRVLMEEKTLNTQFGGSYVHYLAETRRYV